MTRVIADIPGLVKYELSLVMHALKRAWVLIAPIDGDLRSDPQKLL